MCATRVDREAVLAFRAGANHLCVRLPAGSLAAAAHPGLQDSSPRSAVLALHARVEDVRPNDWESDALVQVWGPRGAVYVVPKRDVGVFTLGVLPRDRARRAEREAVADAVLEALGRREMTGSDLTQHIPDIDHVAVRLANATGRLRIRWDGRDTTVTAARRPRGGAEPARLELLRRHLRCVGPSTPEGFRWWAGLERDDAERTWAGVGDELAEVDVKGTAAWLLADDVGALRRARQMRGVRLLPPGDPYLGGADRDRLVPQAAHRRAVWPPKNVWPGALLVDGEVAGTWRRQVRRVTITAWGALSTETRDAVEAEALSLPIEGRRASVRWT